MSGTLDQRAIHKATGLITVSDTIDFWRVGKMAPNDESICFEMRSQIPLVTLFSNQSYELKKIMLERN